MREDLMRDSEELDAEMAKYKQEAEDMESEKKDMGEELAFKCLFPFFQRLVFLIF